MAVEMELKRRMAALIASSKHFEERREAAEIDERRRVGASCEGLLRGCSRLESLLHDCPAVAAGKVDKCRYWRLVRVFETLSGKKNRNSPLSHTCSRPGKLVVDFALRALASC